MPDRMFDRLRHDLATVAKAETICRAGMHSRVDVSAVCGHRDVCVRCGDHRHRETCHAADRRGRK